MITNRRIAALAAALVAIGFAFGGTLLGATPAKAQDDQQTPWYAPQSWMYPTWTGPTGQRRPGDYGAKIRYGRSYGSFSTNCYGDCGPRGTIRTSYGAYITRPVTVTFDARAYALVPRSSLVEQQVYAEQPASYSAPQQQIAPAKPVRYSTQKPTARQKPQAQFTVENGVRIIRPKPVM